jgi:hypothetical protein
VPGGESLHLIDDTVATQTLWDHQAGDTVRLTIVTVRDTAVALAVEYRTADIARVHASLHRTFGQPVRVRTWSAVSAATIDWALPNTCAFTVRDPRDSGRGIVMYQMQWNPKHHECYAGSAKPRPNER